VIEVVNDSLSKKDSKAAQQDVSGRSQAVVLQVSQSLLSTSKIAHFFQLPLLLTLGPSFFLSRVVRSWMQKLDNC
jgi:hypothetical protein